jgi:lambda repressor-like predicted transcriptional regulator
MTVLTDEERRLLLAGPIQAELERHRAQLRMVSRRSGVSHRTVQRIVNGHQPNVRRYTADSLAIAMGTHVALLYGREMSP